MSKIKLLVKGSTLRVAQTFVSIIVGFLMMPFLIHMLGEETYGIWVVVSSIAGSFYLLDVGFSSAVTRFSAKYIHEGRHDEANQIISTALAIYAILGVIVLLVSIALAWFGVKLFVEGNSQVGLVQILLILFGIQLALEFPAKALPGVINAFMRYDTIALIRTLKTIIDALCIWYVISAGYGLVAMAIVCLVTSVISTLCYVMVVKHLYEKINISASVIDKGTFFKIFHFSKWVFLFDVSSMMRQKIDVWMVAYFLGPASLTVYYVAVRLAEYAVRFMLQATDMSTPLFIEYHSSNQCKKLRHSLSVFVRIGLFLSVLGMAGFYIVGESFISLWMPEDFKASEAWELLMVVAIARFGLALTAPLQSMLLTLHRHDLSAMLSILELLISVSLCYTLIPLQGLLGAATAMALPTLLVRGIIFPLLVQRQVPFFLMRDVIATLGFIGAATMVCVVLQNFLVSISLQNIYNLLFGGLLTVAIVSVLGGILIRVDELRNVRNVFLKRIVRV